MKKRLLSILLALAMLMPMLPAGAITVQAAAGDEYVSLPITIRDYAADGMLFEHNDEATDGPQNVGATVVQPALRFTAKAGGDKHSATEGTGYVRYKSDGTGIYITYSIPAGYTRNALRYCVVSYRTNAAASSTPTIGHRWNNGSSNDYKTFSQTGYNKGLSGSFYNVVTDLGSGTAAVNYVTFYPRLAKDKSIDIAYVAFFANATDANNYANSVAGNNGKNYSGGNNMQFGLLMGNGGTHDYSGQGFTAEDYDIYMDSVLGADTRHYVKSTDPKQYILPNGAKQTIIAGRTRTGLVSGELDANKHMVYNKKTVDYMAWLLQKTLTVPESNGGNSYNYNYVMGAKVYNDNGTYKDLATVLRGSITGVGNYNTAKTKYEAGELSDAKQCSTYYEAAYFLLHNTFVDSKGYGQTIDNYNSLRLMKRTAADGHTYYEFGSQYNNTDYNYNNGYIANTGFVYDQIYHTGWVGLPIPLLRFDPIGNRGYGINGNPYRALRGNAGGDGTSLYNETNYNLTLEGHAQFIYYEDDSLYFTFTGDDDVYLFINDKLVLDLGGAHSVSKVTISLNDVRDICGLKNGQVYDFDFFYMERHGTAATFGIETNIKIVDPSMVTEKEVYQNDTEIGYNGYVDPNQPLTYSFSLSNNGDAKIEDLTFVDSTIGVTLNKTAITLNSATTLADLDVVVTAADGTEKIHFARGTLTTDDLKNLLQTGLEVGEKILLRGFKYTVPTASWVSDKFTNTVTTTAISYGENASTKTLTGIASATVQKQNFVYTPIHYYEWKGKGVTISDTDLIAAVTRAGVTDPGSNIQLCSPSGVTTGTAINEKAQRVTGGIKYTGTATGADTFYYKVGNYGPVAVSIYSYDVSDNVYVLDYSLPVELNGPEFGLMVNDTLTLKDNPHATISGTLGVKDGTGTTNYGSFTYSADTASLKYAMTSFMNGEDSVTVRVQVLEDGATELTSKTGVVMEETVKVVPANVVYYEDDFPGITYINTDNNGWAHYKTADSEGNEQSADQDSPYGSDPNYDTDKGTEYTLVLDTTNLNAVQQQAIAYLNAQLGLTGGDSSNGSISALVVKETADVLSFEFKGTGFEIISRTTQDAYAVISVKVERKNADGTTTVVKQFPVITESKGGDLYQVPIISVTGLDRAEYKVTLKATGSTATKTRVLYIDGVRIYQPLEDVDALEYYNPDEAQAQFFEIKSLIGEGKIIYADISNTGDETLLVTGTTMIECGDTTQLLDTTEDVNSYLKLGPNNELYLDGSASNTFLAFYLYPKAGVEDNARTIEIGAHRKASYTSDLPAAYPVQLIYGSTADAVIAGTYSYTVESGTEQYYAIDVKNLVYDATKKCYLLLVGTNDMDNYYVALALTKLKVSGYEIGLVENEASAAAAANAPENSPALVQLRAVRSHYIALAPQESVQQPAEAPKINESLVINSAVLRASKIVSGKNATLTVKVSGDAAKLVVLDASGAEVEFTRCTSGVKDGITTYQAIWSVTGSRGESLGYTVLVYDADSLRSSNTIPITVTIK